jgi:hypothetical protein
MRRNPILWIAIVSVLMVLFASSAAAFGDIPNSPEKEKVLQLKKKGIVNGIAKGKFGPHKKLTYAQGVTMIAAGFHLKPDWSKADDDFKFDNISKKAWYADHFLALAQAGIDIPKDVDPHAVMTREVFTHYLFQAVLTTGDYAFIELYIVLADEDEVDPEYMDSIQKMIVSGIATLDDNKNFRPKAPITRLDAVVMLHDAIAFVKKHRDDTDKPADPVDDVTMYRESVADGVDKITLSWGEKPNSGYGLQIEKIHFKDRTATIYYRKIYPDPDRMYLQVITEPKAVTYIASDYDVRIQSVKPDGPHPHKDHKDHKDRSDEDKSGAVPGFKPVR